ncbi:MAG: hypothetical protein IID44_30030 [Planctomycetes bacterium]|nr:hypothetical protein [Planctomycetota bacterium]
MKSLSFLAVVAAVFVFHSSASAGPFHLQIVAEAGDVIDGRTITGFSSEVLNVAINNDREVAFFANVAGPQGSGSGVMTQRRFIAGAGKVVDGHVPSFGDEPDLVMNNLGEVAYRANLDAGQSGRGLYVNETLLVRDGDVIDGHTILTLGKPPRINDAGTVLFVAQTPEFDGLFSQSTLLIREGQSFDGLTLHSRGDMHINTAGEVAFRAEFDEFQGGTIATLGDGIVLREGDVIAGLTVERIRGFGGITNDGDIVTRIAGSGIDGEPIAFIATQDRILFRQGDIVAGIEVSYITGANVVLNDNGEFAFLGAIDAPGENGYFRDKRGILFASGQLVVSEQDVLDGKIIRFVYPNFDMNDRGDVAFRVVFEDFSQAVVVATPIPEPSSAALAALGVLFLLASRDMQRPGRDCPTRNEEVVR